MTNKSRVNFTVDPYILKRFDKRVSNRSKRLQEFMKKTAEIEEGKNQDLVNRKEKLEKGIKKLGTEIEELKADKTSKENELKAIESTLEQEEKSEEMAQRAVEALKPKFKELRRKTHDPDEAANRLGTTETFHTWLEKIDFEQNELKKKVKEKAEM